MTAEVAQSAAEQQPVPEKKNFHVLNVLAEKVSGTVKWFSVRLHYGFIQRDDNKEDVFVHRTAITASKFRYPTLKNGESVEFNVVETPSGVNAASVTGPNGQNVQGAAFYRYRYRSFQANGRDGHSSMNGGISQASGDGEGSRPARGGRRMRRGRRNFRGPSQNGGGGGDGGEVANTEGGEQTGESEGTSRQQRQRRYRGGRGGGRPRSTSTKQAGEASAEGEERDAGAEGSRPPARRGGRGGRRGATRFRRGGARNGSGPQRGDGGEGIGENSVMHDPRTETKPIDESESTAPESKPMEVTELSGHNEEAIESKSDNLETKIENLSLGEKHGENAETGNGEGAPVKAAVAEGGSN
ncbi:unnamed protein product [Hymenolepis diminuta]|uniref:CSD domain-containing protein n=1 Tax=Hymenolepis diminuta TaxID=6216 RepID=A0A564YGS1_HYMDI|nr:unnamed protein product [Hymenolepis diminuta]